MAFVLFKKYSTNKVRTTTGLTSSWADAVSSFLGLSGHSLVLEYLIRAVSITSNNEFILISVICIIISYNFDYSVFTLFRFTYILISFHT